ncbi:MAG: uracil-DNA glycosylase [Sphingomonadales bacterium]|nr:MAG: uracil-DNA glycosylase [Sphingomonadales bacterium]
MTPKTFLETLASVELPSVFNPWGDTCAIHDRDNAAATRRANLQIVLEAALDAKVETMWIARDLGYRGGRRTGVPLTDEVHLGEASQLMGGVALERATVGPIVAERTAAIVWQVLSHIGEPVMLWNVFPFHPHERNEPFSNRCHTRIERQKTWPLLQALVSMIRPKRVMAIGRDAHMALADLDVSIACVRHPSYGGQREFIDGMYRHYGFDRRVKDQAELELSIA